MTLRRVSRDLSIALASAWLALSAAQAQPVSLAGKRVTVLIGYSPGGVGYDTYGRALARYLGRYLPGAPSVIAEDRPGAGSMTLSNYMYNAAPRDGTEIAIVGRGVATEKLIMGAATTSRFDAARFNWLGSMNNEVSGLYLRAGAPASGLADLLAGKPAQAGSTGAGGDQQIFSQMLNNVLGMKLHAIPGYPGTNEILLAMLRGELDAIAGYSWGAAKIGNAAELKSGQIRIVLQLAMQKHPDLPDVPLVSDLISGAQQKQVLELIMSRQSMGRPLLAPPGLKPELVAVYRTAVADVMRDPDFLAEAERVGLELNYVSGEDVQALVERMYGLPQPVIAQARSFVDVTSP